MTTIIKAANAEQFLAFVPRLLGFRPTQSLVLVPFDGSRSLGAMRLDLPQSTDQDELDRVAATFVGMLCRIERADAVAAVTYTDEPYADDRSMPQRALIDAVERRLDASGLRLTDALCVAGDAWGSYVDPRCPTGGRSLGDLGIDPPEAAMIAEGDQRSGAALPAVDPVAVSRTADALNALHDAITLLCGSDPAASSLENEPERPARVNPQALEAVCTLDDLPTLFEAALHWDAEALGTYDAAALAWCLSRPALRDIALSQWSGGFDAGDQALDAQLRWEAGEEYPADLAMHMWGEGEQPDAERLRSALAIARRIAALAPREVRPGALASCAWLAWALGQSTHAVEYAQHTCDIEPEHGLGRIVLGFVEAGHLPDWAFRRASRG